MNNPAGLGGFGLDHPFSKKGVSCRLEIVAGVSPRPMTAMRTSPLHRILVFASLALAAASPLSAQQAPKQPYLKPLPDFVEWTIEVGDGEAQANAPQDPAQNAEADPVRKKIIVTKMAQDRREIEIWSNGAKTEIWAVGKRLLYEFPGNEKITNTQRLDFSDFSEFQWLSPKNFRGVEKFEGKPCYVFREKLPGSEFEWSAWVDMQSGRPVALLREDGLRKYRFHETPPSREALPERFAKVLQEFQESRQKLKKHHAMKL